MLAKTLVKPPRRPRTLDETFDRVYAFLDPLELAVDGTYRLCNKAVQIELHAFAVGQVFIDHIEVWRKPGKGYGGKALQIICDWADSQKVDLVLTASAFSHKALSSGELVTWYRRYGFKSVSRLRHQVKYSGQRMLRRYVDRELD